MPTPARPTTVPLVLGSGVARGHAHIGVIHWLEQHGLQIVSISGASIGALVVGVFAAPTGMPTMSPTSRSTQCRPRSRASRSMPASGSGVAGGHHPQARQAIGQDGLVAFSASYCFGVGLIRNACANSHESRPSIPSPSLAAATIGRHMSNEGTVTLARRRYSAR